MPAENVLLITVVTGLLLLGVGSVIARLGRRDGPIYLPNPRRSSTRRRSETITLGVVVLLVVVAGGLVVADAWVMVLLGLFTLITAYFAWGIYSLARLRGLPEAHAVGLSVWLVGVVLVGGIAAKLLLG